MSTSSQTPTGFALIGPGAVGTALAIALERSGYRPLAVVGRNIEDAERLAHRIRAPIALDRLEKLHDDVRLVFCTVPDDALVDLAASLARSEVRWEGRTLVHTSGVAVAEVFDPVIRRGAEALSFHPMQTFASPDGDVSFHGITIGIEGSERALVTGRSLASALGAHVVELTSEDKTLYHLGAVIASNFLVTLLGNVEETYASIGIDPVRALDVVRPLAEASLRNAFDTGPEKALTGPVVRGDLGTLVRHIDALERALPHLVPIYAAHTMETVRLAVRSGRLDAKRAEQVLDTVHELVDRYGRA